jgi:Cu-processing system permease protein
MIHINLLLYQLKDGLRSKTIVAVGLFFASVTELLFRFGGSGESTMLSLMNISLSIIPLTALVFGTIYVYNNREFIELMLSQPIQRTALFTSMYLGLTLSLAFGFTIGVGIPSILRSAILDMGIVLATGILLIFIFIAIAFISALKNDEKIKGMGLAIIIWLFLTILYDALIMLLIALYAQYPLERPVLILAMLNPVDLGRILLVLSADESAMMGFTGALYNQFFGSQLGVWISVGLLFAWILLPTRWGLAIFKSKDF